MHVFYVAIIVIIVNALTLFAYKTKLWLYLVVQRYPQLDSSMIRQQLKNKQQQKTNTTDKYLNFVICVCFVVCFVVRF